ncbi:beta-lactamase class A [Brachybacterium muris]|uniref:Beta-lactamase n=1 Tax=Brachybacterium muris UCD-AY4 TaxID=1249481 RepID=A0A022KSJ2_9MICO|nr:serine hydrolase [Brachybacterium muris]EYT48705.1 beta-lactamase [Brachybacterium muris UCD-AY4]MBM7499288.1 beta-lactamase class A [Brachybacterium muris]MCT1430384.1 class A beta-lactamase-related serine hydrolase [Brachybacterium muris]MCT2177192.1 class A beta-lactamase-related serine hydrolase [Brachybacterium muris]MCT2260690.1 class A beta-lactamase-related serine hydrolase [Brachybacterium muris]
MSLSTAAPPTERHVAIALAGADGSLLHSQDPDRPFYAASTIKLHVLMAVLNAVDAGHLDLDRTEPARRTFTGVDGAPFTLFGDHLDPTHPADGQPITVRELAVRMIDRSSNEGTDHLIELVGLPAVATAIDGLGLTATRAERLIGDAAAIDQGLTLETTPADLVRTVRAMVGTSSNLQPDHRVLAREAMSAQRITIISSALRPEVPVGSKSGWVDGYRHDVAFIGDPDGPEVRYLAVMTAGMVKAEADEVIRARVRELLPDLAR